MKGEDGGGRRERGKGEEGKWMETAAHARQRGREPSSKWEAENTAAGLHGLRACPAVSVVFWDFVFCCSSSDKFARRQIYS